MEILLTIIQQIDNPATITCLVVGIIVTFLFSCIAMMRSCSCMSVQKQPDMSTSAFDSLQDQLRDMHIQITENKKTIQMHGENIPRVAIVRFNPFKDSGVGGNQSFSLANINTQGNGFLVTHLFSREFSRVSSKQIVDWKSDIELSPEEVEAINQIKNTQS